MSATTSTAGAAAVDDAAELEERDVRALTEYLAVVDCDAPGLFTGDSEDGTGIYTVDVETGACTCKDMTHRAPEGGCKHYRRAAFRAGVHEGVDLADRLDAVVERVVRLGSREWNHVEFGGDCIELVAILLAFALESNADLKDSERREEADEHLAALQTELDVGDAKSSRSTPTRLTSSGTGQRNGRRNGSLRHNFRDDTPAVSLRRGRVGS